MRVTESNFVKIGHMVTDCDFTIFQNGGRRHLGFSKIQILPADMRERPNLRKPVKFHQDQPIGC